MIEQEFVLKSDKINSEKERKKTRRSGFFYGGLLLSLLIFCAAAVFGFYQSSNVISQKNKIIFHQNIAQYSYKMPSGDSNLLTGNILQLRPVLTNIKSHLADINAGQLWVRLEPILVLKPSVKLNLDQQQKVVDSFFGYLKNTSLEQLQGGTGLMHLKEDLKDRANLVTHDAVDQVLIRSLLIQ